MPPNHEFREAVLAQAHDTLARPGMSTASCVWANKMIAKYECKIAGCGRPKHSRSMCMAHYGRWTRHVSVAGPIGDRPGRQPGLSPRLSTYYDED
jgi:hypothetical protein